MDYISGWCRSKRRLSGLTAVVTGANAGIGRETTLDLYLRGARVVMACRDIKKAELVKLEMEKSSEATEGKGCLVVQQLNLSSLQSVRDFAERTLAREASIHILINNAGVMMCPQGKTEDGFETHMGTNHFGHALLTLMLLPRIVKSSLARIVFVSSRVHSYCDLDLNDINFQRTPYDPLSAYCRSKAANVLFSRALARKLHVSMHSNYLIGIQIMSRILCEDLKVLYWEAVFEMIHEDPGIIAKRGKRYKHLQAHNITNVTSYSLHPGVVATGIGRHFDATVLRGATWLFDNLLSWFLKSPRCGAQTTIYCAVDPACATDSGLYYRLSIDWPVRAEPLTYAPWKNVAGVVGRFVIDTRKIDNGRLTP